MNIRRNRSAEYSVFLPNMRNISEYLAKQRPNSAKWQLRSMMLQNMIKIADDFLKTLLAASVGLLNLFTH